MYDPCIGVRQEQHSQDLLREAAGNQFVRRAQAESGQRSFICCALAGLGRWLAATGARLVARYGAASTSVRFRPVGFVR